MAKKNKNSKSLYAPGYRPVKHTYVNLPCGGHASFVGTPDAETIAALNAMVKIAKKMKR